MRARATADQRPGPGSRAHEEVREEPGLAPSDGGRKAHDRVSVCRDERQVAVFGKEMAMDECPGLEIWRRPREVVPRP
jgi:hypothetical protein